MGFFIALRRRIVVCLASLPRLVILLASCGLAAPKRYSIVLACSPMTSSEGHSVQGRATATNEKRTSCDVLLRWLRGWDLNLMVLPNSLRRIWLRSPRGSDSPPDCHSLPLRPFATLTTSELFALRAHNPATKRIKSHSISKKKR